MHFSKTVLTGINASFSHTAYSIYTLARIPVATELLLREYTINETLDSVYRDLLSTHADLYGFSCYLWNIEYIVRLVQLLKLAKPEVKILLGGPEVSYDTREWLEAYPQIDMILEGEGEVSWPLLFTDGPREVPGLWHRNDGKICEPRGFRSPDLSKLPPVYDNFTFEPNRLYYYEASRGCPYRCSFCLSSTDRLRVVPMDQVKRELQTLAQAKIKVVKFIDRTMNADSRRFIELIDFIESIDHGETTYHMEIHPSALAAEDIQRLSALRKGLLQFEIGVQSTNPTTCQAIHRVGETDDIARKIHALRKPDNIHLHLDLIAGLPYEGMEEFKQSFHDVLAMKPHKLQMGFLKLLRGTKLRTQAADLEIIYSEFAPYEVIKTRWLSADELAEIKDVSHVVEVVYNEGWLTATLRYLQEAFSSPWDLYQAMAVWGMENGWLNKPMAKSAWYDFCFEFGLSQSLSTKMLADVLRFDALSRSPEPPRTKNLSFTAWRAKDFLMPTVQHAICEKFGSSDESMFRKTRQEDFSFDVVDYMETGVKRNVATRYLFHHGDDLSIIRV